MDTNRQPRPAACRIQSRVVCWLTPPEATAVFLGEIPPKATMSSAWPASVLHADAPPKTRPGLPMTCGSSTSEVPAL